MSAYVIGIDQGTTGTRTVVMDERGAVAGTAYRAHPQYTPQPGWVEHDALEIWQGVCETVVESVKALPADATVAGLAVANQGETIVAWDRISGKPLHRALVWQDTRTQAAVAKLEQDEAFARQVRDVTGLRLDPYFSAPKMRWLLENVPAVQMAAQGKRLCLGTLDSWLIWKLTRGESYVSDAGTAARTLLFDLRKRTYDEGLLARFGVPKAALPQIRDSDGVLGHALLDDADLHGVPIVASLVDQPAAMLGHGCLAPGDVKATFGTGCFVYLNTGAEPRPSRHGLLTTLAWVRGGKPTYALDGGIFAAGSVVTWLRDKLKLFSDEKEVDAICAEAADSGDVVCVPVLAGLAAPWWQRDARGAVFGLGLSSGRPQLLRAALEGIAWQVAAVVEAMEKDAGVALERLKVDGGLTACETLMQLQADALGLPVDVLEEPEATATGACWLALRATGLWTSDDELVKRVRVKRTYEPQMDAAKRENLRERFLVALQTARDWIA